MNRNLACSKNAFLRTILGLCLSALCMGEPPLAQSPGSGRTSAPSLLKHATRVTGPKDWAADERVTAHFWLTNNKILFFRFTSEAELWRYDLTARKETSLNLHIIEAEGGPYISPDGRWLLFEWPGLNYAAWELDGSGSAHWDAPEGIVGWLDSHHLVGIGKRQAYIYSVDAPSLRHSVPLPRTSLLLSKAIENQDLCFVSPSRFLAHTRFKENAETLHGVAKVDLYAGRLDADAQHTRHYIFPMPAGYRIFDAVYSPDGTQVAWLLQSSTTGQVSIRVSRLNLSEMHELGTLADRLDGNQGPYLADRFSLQWLPTGRRLSFLYQKALWTVPASTGSPGKARSPRHR